MSTPRRGELWGVVGPRRHKRLALVTARHDDLATIMLVHPYGECATHHDAGFAAGAVMPYALWVQTDVRGVVFTQQCVERFATFDVVQYGHVCNVAGGGVDGDGMVLVDDRDPRWAFKLAEGEIVRTLCADATLAALDGTW